MRLLLKRALLGIGMILTLPLLFMNWFARLFLPVFLQKKAFGWGGEIVSLIPTIIGNYARRAYYFVLCTGVSPDAHFLLGSTLAFREVIIRKGTVIGPYCDVSFADIGENVLFGSRISVISGKYQHGRPEQRADDGPIEEEHVVISIGSNSWIGSAATILANIGENCTVGAGSVVLKDIPEGTTVLGNPARKVNL